MVIPSYARPNLKARGLAAAPSRFLYRGTTRTAAWLTLRRASLIKGLARPRGRMGTAPLDKLVEPIHSRPLPPACPRARILREAHMNDNLPKRGPPRTRGTRAGQPGYEERRLWNGLVVQEVCARRCGTRRVGKGCCSGELGMVTLI
jgi:hypothetical protein